MVRKYLQYIYLTKDESRIYDEFIEGNNSKIILKNSQKILQKPDIGMEVSHCGCNYISLMTNDVKHFF